MPGSVSPSRCQQPLAVAAPDDEQSSQAAERHPEPGPDTTLAPARLIIIDLVIPGNS